MSSTELNNLIHDLPSEHNSAKAISQSWQRPRHWNLEVFSRFLQRAPQVNKRRPSHTLRSSIKGQESAYQKHRGKHSVLVPKPQQLHQVPAGSDRAESLQPLPPHKYNNPPIWRQRRKPQAISPWHHLNLHRETEDVSQTLLQSQRWQAHAS